MTPIKRFDCTEILNCEQYIMLVLMCNSACEALMQSNLVCQCVRSVTHSVRYSVVVVDALPDPHIAVRSTRQDIPVIQSTLGLQFGLGQSCQILHLG